MIRDLTRREQEILELVAEGLFQFDIAKKLFIEESTVKFHVSHILKKLGAHNRAHAVAIGYQNGLLKVGKEALSELEC